MDYFFHKLQSYMLGFFAIEQFPSKLRSYLDVGYQLLKTLFSTLNTNGARY